jgi:ABC-type uncharacterized transport system auxiliary subunit
LSAVAAPRASLASDVAIHLPEASRAFAGTEIAVVDGSAVVYLGALQWADTAPRIAQTALLNALDAADGEGRAFLPETPVEADYEVFWRLSELNVSPGRGPARAAAQVTLVASGTRSVIASSLFISEQRPAAGSDRARAEALAAAVQDVGNQIAEFVATRAVRPT